MKHCINGAGTIELASKFSTGYRAWKSGSFLEQATSYQNLATHGQAPSALAISCSDSRVNPNEVFNAAAGEIFVHRNIANFVPAADARPLNACTASGLEYGITVLKIPNIFVIGHSGCGGIQGCHNKCQGSAPALESDDSFVGTWLEAIRPAYEEIKDIADEKDRLSALERQGVVLSLENLKTYPFVADAVRAGTLELHGFWFDIASGTLEHLDTETGVFTAI